MKVAQSATFIYSCAIISEAARSAASQYFGFDLF
jgi:hypothetical protein